MRRRIFSICDEQNGFRKGRSCLDHIYSLTSIIKNRKQAGKDTHVAFIDMEKAFDRVDRSLLYFKLLKMGIGGKVLSGVKNMYNCSKACLNINGHLTEAFSTDFGVKQGDCLSPTLFSLYINDLVADIKSNSSGVDVGLFKVHCLLYADDLVLLAETEDDLQNMLNSLSAWCYKWRMKVNAGKSKVVHFRPARQSRSMYVYRYNGDVIEAVSQYKYLGIVLDEHLDYNTTACVLADSAGRALGSIYNKFKLNKGFGYNTYSKMYESGVIPILDYCSGVWGYNKLDRIDTVQNRAIRLYLGVHKFAPNKAINADMGWTSSRTRRHINMLRLWNHLVVMSPDRFTRKIFEWDKGERGWCKNIREIMSLLDCDDGFVNNSIVNLDVANQMLRHIEFEQWKIDVLNVPKLRTFVIFKRDCNADPYVYMHNRGQRSAIAQLRCGILPLSIETGRYNSIPLEFRLCMHCNDDTVEDEYHFLFHCTFYSELRQELSAHVTNVIPHYNYQSDSEKLITLMSSEFIYKTSEYVYNAFNKRRSSIYCHRYS